MGHCISISLDPLFLINKKVARETGTKGNPFFWMTCYVQQNVLEALFTLCAYEKERRREGGRKKRECYTSSDKHGLRIRLT